jgi:hypothetical protein
MARIRTIKPEFWTDETLAECSTSARLIFVASLNFADDNGNLKRSARQLKAQAFPYDAFDCEPLILELLDAGLIIEYEIGDCLYLHIKGFQEHQKIDRPSKSRIPLYEPSLQTRRILDESSTSPRPVGIVGKEVDIRKDKDSSSQSSQNAKRLNADWEPSNADAAYAASLGLEPKTVLENFRDYWIAASGAQARKNDWHATWRTWCRRDHDSKRAPSRSNGYAPTQAPSAVQRISAEWAEALSAGRAIDFRNPATLETAEQYLDAVKREQNRGGAKIDTSGITAKLRGMA